MSDIIVPPTGPLDAKLVFICEAPTSYEVNHSPPMPFVGPAGHRFDALLGQAGIFRRHCRIMYVMPTRVKNDDFKYMWLDKKMTEPTEELKVGIQNMYNELTKLPNIQVIVAFGRNPMYILSQNKPVHKPQDGISKWAGSISTLVIPSNTSSDMLCMVKMIPTFHPSFALKQWAINPLIVHDLKRAKGEVDNPAGLPVHKFNSYPSDEYIKKYFNEYRMLLNHTTEYRNYALSADIECYKGMITRISFSYTPDTAISIPFYNYDTDITLSGREWVINLIRDVMATSPVIGQNFGTFDRYWLKHKWNVECNNIVGDTMIAQHVILPGLPSSQKPLSLAMLTRLYTREPYYKDEGKIVSGKKPPPDAQQGKYSNKDAAVTKEIHINQRGTSQFKRRKHTYNLEMNLVTGPIWYMMNRGMKIDTIRRSQLQSRYRKELEWISLTVNTMLGRVINIASTQQLAVLLYDEMGMKAPKKRSTKKDDLLILKAKHPDEKILDYICQYRHTNKIYTTVLKAKLINGRFFCAYSPTTTTGRFKSYSNPFSTKKVKIGSNMQNVVRMDKDPNIRPMFIADDGCYLIEADLEQAELRAVAYYANDQKLIALLEDAKVDIHSWMASKILGREITKKDVAARQLGKRIVHAGNYLISARGLVRTCRIELGIDMKETQARNLLKMYFTAFPAIKRWHHQIEQQLQRNGNVLVTALGRERKFFERWGDELFRKATAFLPQSTIADLLNTIMLKWFDKYNEQNGCQLLMQLHDCFYTQCPKDYLETHLKNLHACFNYPIIINRRTICIPAETKTYLRWGLKADLSL